MTVEMLNAVVGDGGSKLERVKKKLWQIAVLELQCVACKSTGKIAVLEPRHVMHKSTRKLWH